MLCHAAAAPQARSSSRMRPLWTCLTMGFTVPLRRVRPDLFASRQDLRRLSGSEKPCEVLCHFLAHRGLGGIVMGEKGADLHQRPAGISV